MKQANYERVRELGSLALHRACLGLPPKCGDVTPFVCNPLEVLAKQVSALAERLKSLRCRNVVLGLSGGLDSTLAFWVCALAFMDLKYDLKGIHLYTMPGFGTTARTKDNAVRLAERLGLTVETISIVKSVRQHLKDIGHDGVTPDVTYENAQARMRTMILMDKANMTKGIVIGTGDMSEIALGWSTYNGDHMSMFNVNSGVPKTIVRAVCVSLVDLVESRHPMSDLPQIMRDIIDTPVSPELVKGQVTEDTLGPYELHDFFLWNFIMNEMGSKDLKKAAQAYFKGRYDSKTITRTLKTFMHRFFTQAFKRNCAPDGIRVFDFDLSPHGWWIPSDLGEMKI